MERGLRTAGGVRACEGSWMSTEETIVRELLERLGKTTVRGSPSSLASPLLVIIPTPRGS